MKPGIQGIIFDFGNVIYTVDNSHFLEDLSALCGLPPEELHRRIFLGSTLPEDYESGRIGSDAFLEQLSERCGTPITEAMFRRTQAEVFAPIESTHELIRRLKPHYRLGLLSNTNPRHFDMVIRTAPVFPLFDAVTLSYEACAMKPKPAIYLDALAKIGLPAETCVFIDDRPEFAEAATAMGMHGLCFTDGGQLLEDLGRLGIRGLR